MADSLGFLSFVSKEGECQVDAFEFAQPSFGSCSGLPDKQIGFDLFEPGQHPPFVGEKRHWALANVGKPTDGNRRLARFSHSSS
ncbi:hypothetical protein [Nocardia fusca]|uniref:Uncharacterized protein n=1 Tax=Nocardia fusca TaxID=941183 RepID=A0ABV3F446_9NOCA